LFGKLVDALRAVVDTNVAAYYLLGTEPFAGEAQRFWQAVDASLAPTLWEAELANVLWMAIRTGVLSADSGQKRLVLAVRLGIRSVPNRELWRGALTRAVNSGVAVHDTLFVELALRERLPLATFDSRLLGAFPEVARRPEALLPE
jgi:predicted nucleic acid-binding protein